MELNPKNKLLFVFALSCLSLNSRGQDLLYFAKADYYECQKSIRIQIEITNNSKSELFVDTCIAPNYTIDGAFKFNLSLVDTSDTLSIIHPAPLLRPIDLANNNNNRCFVSLKPKESIIKYVNLIKDFNWEAAKKMDGYIAEIGFKTLYLKDKNIRYNYFTKRILESSNRKCFVRIF